MSSTRSAVIAQNLRAIRLKIASNSVRLVAVSKKMPVEDIMTAYECGQRDFGENYVNELLEKSRILPSDIRWHFIGHLQSNKAKALTSISNLSVVETVDSSKIASALNRVAKQTLSVFIQVNTSGEQSKSGVEPSDCLELADYIRDQCPALKLTGLMTIGEAHGENEVNPDFKRLIDCKKDLVKAGYPQNLELSMGMSADFVDAIRMGSTSVRVGSLLFGQRSQATAD